MGKKSKRKAGGGANAKAARKEKLQERREVQLADTNHQSGCADEYKRPLLVGDRVWLPHGEPGKPDTWRGNILKFHDDNTADIRVLAGSKNLCMPLDYVFPDFKDLTLRFGMRERVVFFCHNEWIPGTIAVLWPPIEGYRDEYGYGYDEDSLPICPDDIVPCYAVGYDGHIHYVPYDHDGYIQRRPMFFRLSVGQKCVFNLDKAVDAKRKNKKLKLTSPWQKATITECEIIGLSYYAVYECQFNANGATHTYHILKDDDEHVAREDADPRSRLFDAIEQDCQREHFIDLVTTFDIDVSTFRDLLVNKAIESGSYNALTWLQHDCKIDVLSIRDDEGNNILHKIASSSNATRFIKRAGEVSMGDRENEWTLSLTSGPKVITNSLNNSGENWLQFLVRCGDVKALDAALSPNVGFVWDMMYEHAFEKNNLSLLAESIKESGNATMQSIFGSFASFRKLALQARALVWAYKESEEEVLNKEVMSVFRGENAMHHAKLLTRFYLDWFEHAGSHLANNPFRNIPSKGYSHLFSLLYEANNSLFLGETYRVCSNEDHGEYLQPELSASSAEKTSYDSIEVGLQLACIIGDDGSALSGTVSSYEKESYLRIVWKHATCNPDECPSFLDHLKKMEHYYNGGQSYKRKDHWVRKIGLLEDSKNIEGRLKILEYLLQHQKKSQTQCPGCSTPPSVWGT